MIGKEKQGLRNAGSYLEISKRSTGRKNQHPLCPGTPGSMIGCGISGVEEHIPPEDVP